MTIRNTHSLVFIIILFMSTVPHTYVYGQFSQPILTAEQRDTVKEDNPFAVPDSLRKKRNLVSDSARSLNAMNYVMDYRYLAQGDTIDKGKWYKDMFIQMGLGAEEIAPPNKYYKFNTLTTFHLGFGKQFGPYHSLRMLGQGAIGYQQNKDRLYLRWGLTLDHSFDLSSYASGYKPTRPVNISTLLGVGMHRALMRGTGIKATPVEIHGGLQFRFYTGPHGMVNIEPFCELASDDIDFSGNINWRRYDVTYGLNMNMVYYFDNHLTRAKRHRMINESKEKNPNNITSDSLHLYSWQKPWIFEFAGGPIVNDIPNMSLMETMGHEVALSVGKWFSPAIGIRGSVMTRHSDWAKKYVVGNNGYRYYEQIFSSLYVGGRVEAMVNPLGMLKSFRWDAPFGAYITGGAGLGWFIKHKDSPSLHCWSESYTVGLHLWYRLTDGLQIFLEPRYMHNVYNIPYRNKNWSQNFSDNSYGVNIGVTSALIEKRYRKYAIDHDSTMSRFAVGLGAGMNLIMSESRFKGKKPFNYNYNGFLEYRLNKTSAVRLGFAFFSFSTSDYSAFKDYNTELPNEKPAIRNGLWHYTNRIGFAALDYDINLTNALCGYRSVGSKGSRLFNLDLFFGPGIAFHIKQSSELDINENLREYHEAKTTLQDPKGTLFALNGGVKLSAHLTKHIGITLSPQIYLVPLMEDLKTVKMGRLRTFEMLDLGLQYQF